MSDSATPSHPVPTPSRTESATPSPVPSPYRDGDRVASPTSHTPTEDISAESDFRRIAAALVGEHGWNRATLIATAVRGYVYDRPNPGPYREDAEAIYRRLGWEQAALLACWFRDSRNWPSTNKPSGRRPGGWPGPTALSNVPRTEST